jgi:N-methylhydantoinase B/oxoprolinase/acetone carboxylase alpha subunit
VTDSVAPKPIDPVLTTVLANRMDGIVREMINTILRTARSAVINSARDFSCAICTADNELFACAEGLPIHIFGADRQAKTMCEYHPDLAEGDCYLHNDPYTGNSHAADHTFLVPVFFEGEHLFTAVAKAHQADIGNSLPTCYMPSAKDIYEEGALIFPAVRIQRNYQMVDDIVRMAQRRIRVPSQWYGDFLAGISAARVAERRLKEFCEKYGKETVKTFIVNWLDYSERVMVHAIKKLPSAELSNTGWHDAVPPILPDGIPIKVDVSIRPEDAIIEVDLRDNIDNLDCGYNLSEACSISAVMAGIFNNLEGDIPRNAGSFRRVKILLREGAVVGKPKFPHCCSVATTNVADRLVNATGAAFAQLGDGFGLAEGAVGLGLGMAVLSGLDHRHGDAPYVNQIHISANGGPASAHADGWVTYGIPIISGLMYRDSVEVDELKHPFQIRRLELMQGSGGAGAFRGAPGAVVEYGPKKHPLTVIYPGDGQQFKPKGVRGGHDGQLAERWLVKADGTETRLPNAAQIVVEVGDFVRGIDCSGGGYGSPLARDPAKVLHDVIERYETVERAAEIYGVELTGSASDNSLAVDFEATRTRRKRS